jgi:hypothetical protein
MEYARKTVGFQLRSLLGVYGIACWFSSFLLESTTIATLLFASNLGTCFYMVCILSCFSPTNTEEKVQ